MGKPDTPFLLMELNRWSQPRGFKRFPVWVHFGPAKSVSLGRQRNKEDPFQGQGAMGTTTRPGGLHARAGTGRTQAEGASTFLGPRGRDSTGESLSPGLQDWERTCGSGWRLSLSPSLTNPSSRAKSTAFIEHLSRAGPETEWTDSSERCRRAFLP